MKEVVFKSGTKPWRTFVLTLLQSRPYQVSGSCAGGSESFLIILSTLNLIFLRQPGGSKESRKMAEALVLPAFFLRQLLQLPPCLLTSSFLISTAIGSNGKVKAAPVSDHRINIFFTFYV